MAENNSSPFGAVQVTRDMLAAQQGLLSKMANFERLSEAVQIVSTAQMAYGQALMQANTMLFGMFLPSAGRERDITPSEAAHQPDCAA